MTQLVIRTKKQSLLGCISIYLPQHMHLSHYFAEPTSVAITVASLLKHVSNIFAPLETEIVAHSSLQNGSNSVRLDRDHLWKLIPCFAKDSQLDLCLSCLWLCHSNNILWSRQFHCRSGWLFPCWKLKYFVNVTVFLQCPVFGSVHLLINPDQLPCHSWTKAYSQHDALTTMLYGGDGMLTGDLQC